MHLSLVSSVSYQIFIVRCHIYHPVLVAPAWGWAPGWPGGLCANNGNLYWADTKITWEACDCIYTLLYIYTRADNWVRKLSTMYMVDSSRTQLPDPYIFKKGFISGDLWSTVVNSMINFNFMIRHIWMRISVVWPGTRLFPLSVDFLIWKMVTLLLT